MAPMKRRVRFAAALLVVGALAAPVASRADDPSDPVVEGKAISTWEKDLAEGNTEAAKSARAAIRRAGKVAVPALIRLVEGTNVGVVGFACDALAALGPQAVAAVPALVARLDAEGAGWPAARTLEKIGGAAVPALASGLASEKAVVRLHVARILGRLASSARDGLDALLLAAGDKDLSVRTEVVRAIGMIALDAERSVKALVAALATPNDEVRATAAQAIARFGRAAASAEPALLRITSDSNATVRAFAFAALVVTGDDPALAGPAAIAALADIDENVRAAAATVLGVRHARGAGLAARVLALAKDPSRAVRGAAARAVRGVGATFVEARPVLVSLLSDAHPPVVLEALDAIAGYGPEAAAALTELREDRFASHPDPAVRERVASTIRAITGT